MRRFDDRILFGAAYYHEYHGPGAEPKPEQLERDLDLMVEAGFTVIRVGESVWSTWEPEDGRFDLDWLEPVLDGAGARGIEVVLGTPTYALPPWMVRRYPEIAGEHRTGQRLGWGARQEADFTHPAFRFYGERVLRRIVERYRDHPAVTGYQVDNEPGLHLLHNRGVFERFVDHLRHQYGDVQTLNREWGLVYWSHRLSTWADLWTPDGNAQPQYDLAWRRFQASLTTEMIAWQADAVRELARPDQFVTTCISYERPALDDADLAGVVDVTAGNPYYGMQDHLEHPTVREAGQYWTTHGTWAVVRSADLMYSSRGEPYLVTETDAQAIGGSAHNYPAYPGQWRQAAWALIARGARLVEYWHWHTLHYGAETYWGGVLPHSGRPGRTYREIAALGQELAHVGPEVAATTPDADITFLYSSASRWALAFQPALQRPDGEPDPSSYPRIVGAFYRGAFDAGRQARLIRPVHLFASGPEEAVAHHPVLVAAGYYPASDADIAWLEQYAAAGGHLVLGPRSLYADHEGRAREQVQPAGLSAAAGVFYDEFTNLDEPVPVVPGDRSGLVLPDDATATDWADGLTLGCPPTVGRDAPGRAAPGQEQPGPRATVLARYVHPHFGVWPAVTTRAHGSGRVTVVGTVPGAGLARALARWLVPEPVAGWADLPESVTVHTATRPDGARVRVVHNWSWGTVSVTAPVDLRVLAPAHGPSDLSPSATAPSETNMSAPPRSGARLAAGDTVTLGAWDVLVVVTA